MREATQNTKVLNRRLTVRMFMRFASSSIYAYERPDGPEEKAFLQKSAMLAWFVFLRGVRFQPTKLPAIVRIFLSNRSLPA
jgi:hypothetical protein